MWRRSSTVPWIASFFDGMLLPPGAQLLSGSTYPGARPPPPRRPGSSAPSMGPSRRTRHGHPVASITVEERRAEPPAVDDQGHPVPEGAPTPPPRSSATGSPCRLALVAATGPTRAATARTRSWSGTRSPIGARRLAEVEVHAGSPREHEGQRARPPARRRPRRPEARTEGSARRERLLDRGAEHRERDVGGPALEREERGRRGRVGGQRRQPVDGVGRQHDDAAVLQGRDDLVDAGHRGTRREPTHAPDPSTDPLAAVSAAGDEGAVAAGEVRLDVGRREAGGPGERRGRPRPASRRSRRRARRPGASHAGRAATICSMASRPVGPGTRAVARLPVRHLRRQRVVGGDVGRVGRRRRRRGRAARRAGRRTSRPRPAARPRPGGRGRRGWRGRPPARRATRRWPTPRRRPALGRERQRDGARAGAEVDREAGAIERGQRVDGEARRRPRSPGAGSAPAGRRRGRACGTPTGRARTAAARPRPAGATIWSTKRTSRSVTGVVERRDLLGRRPAARPLDDPADLLLGIVDRRARAAARRSRRAAARQRQGHPVSPSRRACSSATRASTTSSSSPASTLSSL